MKRFWDASGARMRCFCGLLSPPPTDELRKRFCKGAGAPYGGPQTEAWGQFRHTSDLESDALPLRHAPTWLHTPTKRHSARECLACARRAMICIASLDWSTLPLAHAKSSAARAMWAIGGAPPRKE